VVDDGIATGSTARAACQVARAQGANRVVLAVPVAPPGWTARFQHDADELVCLETPESFFAIGEWYADFSQTADEVVSDCLERRAASGITASAGPCADPPGWDEKVHGSSSTAVTSRP
jgi:putative phosphoribosyl transferase